MLAGLRFVPLVLSTGVKQAAVPRTPVWMRAGSMAMAGAFHTVAAGRKVLVVDAFCGIGDGGRAIPFTGNPAGVVLEEGDGEAGNDRISGAHAWILALRYPGKLNGRGGESICPPTTWASDPCSTKSPVGGLRMWAYWSCSQQILSGQVSCRTSSASSSPGRCGIRKRPLFDPARTAISVSGGSLRPTRCGEPASKRAALRPSYFTLRSTSRSSRSQQEKIRISTHALNNLRLKRVLR